MNDKQLKIAALKKEALHYRRTSRRPYHQENFSRAIKIYERVLNIDPDDVHALLSIGILMRESDPTLALEYLEKALALQPNNPQIWKIKGSCYRELKNIPAELECYYAVRKITPSIMIERYIEGATRRLGQASERDSQLQNFLIDVLLKRSEQLMRARQFSDARADVNQVLQMNSTLEVLLRCKAQEARIDLMEEICERKKQSLSRTTSANDFWSSERGGLKRSTGTDTDKDDNARPFKQRK